VNQERSDETNVLIIGAGGVARGRGAQMRAEQRRLLGDIHIASRTVVSKCDAIIASVDEKKAR
jgi:saccharopine dehydrogenase-like NADP-dependent oxidoreductase